METRDVYFYTMPLKIPFEKLKEEGLLYEQDDFLNMAMDEYLEGVVSNKIELFYRIGNIAVLEDGYRIAISEEEAIFWAEIYDEQDRGYNMKFESTLDPLNKGEALRRNSWEPGVFIFRQVPSNININIVPNMTSLPNQVKNIFVERFKVDDELDSLNYKNQIAIVTADNTISTWTPLPEDLFSTDWEIYKV